MSTAPRFAIEVDALSVFAGRKRLLGPVSLRVERGGAMIIMGETGAGKSLIAQAILGALPGGLAAEGAIRVNGDRVDRLPWRDRAKAWGRDLAMLPQEPWRALDPLMRSAAQVSEVHRFVAGKAWKDADRATEDDFAGLGLAGSGNRMPGALSGGMAQRVAYAAATAAAAPILIADEPTKGLDAARLSRTADLLADVPKHGGSLLAITHDMGLARRLGGTVIVLKEGDLVEEGETAAVLARPAASYTRSLIAAEPVNWPNASGGPHGAMVLAARDLAVARGENTLVADFNLILRAGERVAVTGPSGVGKTSLLDALAGLIEPAAGRVERSAEVSRHGVQKLYQDPPAAFPSRVTLGQSLRDVAALHGIAWSAVEDILARLGIGTSLLDRRPAAVSGGELQRIAIARALAAKPAVLLADEPTSRLDPITQQETMALLAEIASDRGVAVLLVTHDLAMAERWADKTMRLERLSVRDAGEIEKRDESAAP